MIADLEPARLVGVLVARRRQVVSIPQKKVFRPSGRHRIRTCDLYGVKSRCRDIRDAFEMRVFLEDNSEL